MSTESLLLNMVRLPKLDWLWTDNCTKPSAAWRGMLAKPVTTSSDRREWDQ